VTPHRGGVWRGGDVGDLDGVCAGFGEVMISGGPVTAGCGIQTVLVGQCGFAEVVEGRRVTPAGETAPSGAEVMTCGGI